MIVNYLYDKDLKLCNKIDKTGYVDNKWNLKDHDIVFKTQDSTLDKEYILKENLYKIPISFYVEGSIDKPLKIKISDGENEIEKEGVIIERAISTPTTKDTIIEKLSKIHETPFKINKITINIDDNCFIQIKQINELRRILIQELIVKRENIKKAFIEKEVSFKKENNKNSKKEYTCSVINEEQLKECLKYHFKRIYVSDKSLYKKYKENQNIFFKIPNCYYDYQKVLKEKNLMNDIICFRKHNSYGGYLLNNTNKYTGYYLIKNGLKNIPLSCEMNPSQIKNYIEEYKNDFNGEEFEILSYGRIENMLIKGNILNLENKYYKLIDNHKREFPVYYDGLYTHILNHEKRQIDDYNDIICTQRLDFYEETKEDIEKIVNKLD